jgi:hypothetical protein
MIRLYLYGLTTISTSIRTWICQSPVHHVVGKFKIIRCSVTCAMTISALKNVTMKLIRFSGKSISWPKWGHYESSQTTIPKIMSISPIIGDDYREPPILPKIFPYRKLESITLLEAPGTK